MLSNKTKTKVEALQMVLQSRSTLGLANEDTLLRTRCCRHKGFPVCPRAQHLLRTQKMFLVLFRNILCPQQMFPSLLSSRNIMGNNVSSTIFPRLPLGLARVLAALPRLHFLTFSVCSVILFDLGMFCCSNVASSAPLESNSSFA